MIKDYMFLDDGDGSDPTLYDPPEPVDPPADPPEPAPEYITMAQAQELAAQAAKSAAEEVAERLKPAPAAPQGPDLNEYQRFKAIYDRIYDDDGIDAAEQFKHNYDQKRLEDLVSNQTRQMMAPILNNYALSQVTSVDDLGGDSTKAQELVNQWVSEGLVTAEALANPKVANIIRSAAAQQTQKPKMTPAPGASPIGAGGSGGGGLRGRLDAAQRTLIEGEEKRLGLTFDDNDLERMGYKP